MKRREEDKCFIKRLWAKATPYIQMGGWLLVAIPAFMSAVKLFGDAQAFDSRLSAVESTLQHTAHQYDTLNQKLDTVIQLIRRK